MLIAISTAAMSGKPLPTALEAMASVGVEVVDLLVIDRWAHVNPSELVLNLDSSLRQLDELFTNNGVKVGAINAGLGPALYDTSKSSRETMQAQAEAVLWSPFSRVANIRS